ncbi:MAG: 30S ribosomal protein S17, partial [Clostridia bacterium]|nr:30S ribosomal protein S17 [Clostridia bacterium]
MSERAFRKTRVGKVVSDKMDKTCVVAIEDRVQHPLYKKIVKRTQHLLSLVMSVVVAIYGFYFAYNSLEMFVYPTHV